MLTSKGQATIPKAVREHLAIGPGDKVSFVTTPMGRVVLLPKTKALADLYGILDKPERPASQKEIDRARRPQTG